MLSGNRDLRALANADRIQYVDTHVSHGPYLIKNGYLGKIDVAVIEVAAIRADGSLVLPFSVGIDDTLVKYATSSSWRSTRPSPWRWRACTTS